MTREEAIEVYNGLINTKIKEAFEFFAPELRESEDERILRAIIRGFESWKGNGNVKFNNTEVDDILAYLEKQKEPIDPFDTKLFQDGVKEGRRLEREEIKKEQKSAEWSEEDEKIMQTMIKDGDLKPSEVAWLKSRRPSKDCSSCAKHLEGYISGRCDAENKLLEQFGALVTPEGELVIPPRWKPSEEQMEALSDAYVEASTFKKGDVLESLYDQLKKL